jgi:hypothetical protein
MAGPQEETIGASLTAQEVFDTLRKTADSQVTDLAGRVARLTDELDTFTLAWLKLTAQHVSANNDSGISAERYKAALGAFAQALAKTPDRKAVRIVGPYSVALRLAGLAKGPSAGRVPGDELRWNPLPPDSSEVPPKILKGFKEDRSDAPNELAWTVLPFWRDSNTRLWHLWFSRKDFEGDAFAIVEADGNLRILDWRNEQIYEMNEKLFRFSQSPAAYIRCFFHLVRGRGRFLILETEEDLDQRIPWAETTSPDEIRKHGDTIEENWLRPLQRRAINAAGEMVYRSTMLFKNAIFRCDIILSPDGQLRLANEELMAEDLPVNVAAETGAENPPTQDGEVKEPSK